MKDEKNLPLGRVRFNIQISANSSVDGCVFLVIPERERCPITENDQPFLAFHFVTEIKD